MKFQTTPIKTDKGFRFYIENDELLLETDSGKEKVLYSDEDKIIGLRKLENGYVLSISEKNILKFWDAKGKLKSSFSGHESELIFLKTQSVESKIKGQKNHVLVTISKLDKVVIHDLNGKKLSVFDIEMARPEKFRCFQNGIGFLIPDKGLVYYDWNGKEFFRFKDMKEGISDWKQLGNGFVVTDSILTPDERTWWGSAEDDRNSRLGVCLWSISGDLIKDKMDEAFNFDSLDDVDEFSNDSLIITSKDSEIFIVDSKGSQLNSHRLIVESNSAALMKYRLTEDSAIYQKNLEVNEVLSKCKSDSKKVTSLIKDNPSLLDYEHSNNPSYKPIFIPNEHKEQLGMAEKSEVLKKVWDFFNRPILNNLFTVLQSQEKSLNKSLSQFGKIIKSNNLKIEFLQKQINKSTTVLKVFSLLSILTAMIFAGLEEMVGASVAGAVGLVFVFILFNKVTQKKQNSVIKKQIEENNETLNQLINHFKPLVGQIEDYRSGLITHVPIYNDPKLYSGDFVAQHIRQTIDEKIEKTALVECGIVSSEIVYTDQKAILLSDWSLIQTKDDFAKHKFNNRDNTHRLNEFSFFPTKNNGVQFAVQYIQLIFLSNEKLDVFTTFYDFIEDQFISKQTYSFYYKDVTNFSRKDVTKSVSSQLQEDVSSHAVELSLSVSSGEKIDITIQNDDTYSEIMKEIQGEEEITEDRIEELEMEIQELEADSSLSSEDKDKRLSMLRTSLESVEVSNSKISNAEQNVEINQKINSIRSQINQYKKVTEE